MVQNRPEPFWTIFKRHGRNRSESIGTLLSYIEIRQKTQNKQSTGNANSNHASENVLELFDTVLNHKAYRLEYNYILYINIYIYQYIYIYINMYFNIYIYKISLS